MLIFSFFKETFLSSYAYLVQILRTVSHVGIEHFIFEQVCMEAFSFQISMVVQAEILPLSRSFACHATFLPFPMYFGSFTHCLLLLICNNFYRSILELPFFCLPFKAARILRIEQKFKLLKGFMK